MFNGKMIDELIDAVKRAERDARGQSPANTPVKVTRYEVNNGFVYATQFTEPTAVMVVA
jgi:hypothetical protein